MIFHKWRNPGIAIEDALKQGMRDAVNYMTKNDNVRTVYRNGLVYRNGVVVTDGWTKKPDTDWCDETKNYQKKARLVSFSNKKYLIRHGTGSLGFVTLHKNDFTIAHIYKKKEKDWVSTKRFSGKLGWRKIKELLFENAIHIADAKKEYEKPFGTMHKQIVLPVEEFQEQFKPNKELKKSYTSTAKDTALTSLSSLLKDKKSIEIRAGTHSSALNQVSKAISFGKNSYCGTLPAMNVYAIWCNFNPDLKLVNTGKYDVGEPILYQYELIE